MKKTIKLLAVVCLLLFTFFSLPAQDRGLAVVAKEYLGQAVNIGRQYALFIAIDAYSYWPALNKPVADAREIRDILSQDYYIDEVIELYNQNATKEKIIETFENLQERLGVFDSLFIYYAGHGHLDNASKQGFWIPVNGGTNTRSQENWLPNSQIRGYIAGLKTIHVFMVSDACFSGDILNTSRALPPQIDNAYYQRAYGLNSRQVLTSGSSETVPDQSEFSEALKLCLRKNSGALLDPIGIYNDVRLSIRGTTPLYGTLASANHQDGATFLFFRKPATNAPPPSDTAEAHFDKGRLFREREDWDTAILEYTEAIRLDPSYSDAYLGRGIVYYYKKDYDRAITDYTQAIRLDPNYAVAYCNRGAAYDRKGDNDLAIADYTQSIRLDPNYAVAYYNRGQVYYDKKDNDRAIADYTQAIRIDPNYADAYYNRGTAYYYKKDYDLAIADYTQAIRIDPNYAFAYNNRGVTYKDKKDYDRAIADYEAALRIDPNYSLTKSNLEEARRLKAEQ